MFDKQRPKISHILYEAELDHLFHKNGSIYEVLPHIWTYSWNLSDNMRNSRADDGSLAHPNSQPTTIFL
jgi:hypothetical protein